MSSVRMELRVSRDTFILPALFFFNETRDYLQSVTIYVLA